MVVEGKDPWCSNTDFNFLQSILEEGEMNPTSRSLKLQTHAYDTYT